MKQRKALWNIAILSGSLCLSVALLSCGGGREAGTKPKIELPVTSETIPNSTCAKCHKEEAELCEYGAHRSLACVRCHGSGSAHAKATASPRPKLRIGEAKLCLECHQGSGESLTEGPARIGSFESHLESLERDHKVKLDRKKSGRDCVYCHDPHVLE